MTDPHVLDPQLRDVYHRTQEDAMRATIARLTKEVKTAEAERDAALKRGKDGHREYDILYKERDEALANLARERMQANEWLGQLTDASGTIAKAREILGAKTDETLEQVATRHASSSSKVRKLIRNPSKKEGGKR